MCTCSGAQNLYGIMTHTSAIYIHQNLSHVSTQCTSGNNAYLQA